MSGLKPRTLSEMRDANERLFDPNAGYLDTVGGASLIESGLGNSDAVRSFNFNTSKSRFNLPTSDVAKSGVSSFNSSRQTTTSTKPEVDEITRYKNLSAAELEKTKNNSAAELQFNIDRVKQYQPLANNEANRAYGMKLATEFPYAKYEAETKTMNDSASTLANSSVLSSFNNLVANSFPKQYTSF